jgi:hypothetical protein
VNPEAREIISNDTFDSAFTAKPPNVQKRIEKALRFLADNPRHPSLQCHRVIGSEDVWEAYVTRAQYRMTFEYTGQGGIQLLNCCTHNILPRL